MFCRLKQKLIPEEVRKKYQLQSYYCYDDRYRVNKKISFVGNPIDLLDQLIQRDIHFTQGLHLELACGTGEFLLQQARDYPQNRFLGVDYTRSVIQRAIAAANRMNLENIAFFCGTVFDFFAQIKKEEVFCTIWINFSDPWPKKGHHKRRLLQKRLIPTILKKLQSKGTFITATDHKELASHHVDVISTEKQLVEFCGEKYSNFSRYHQKALSKGKEIYYTFHKKI